MKYPSALLGDLLEANPRFEKGDKPSEEELVSFVPMASVSEKIVSITETIDRPYHEVRKGFTPFKTGDVLIAKITPCFENGKMALVENLPRELGFGSTEFHVFRPGKRIFPRYLFHLLRSPFVRASGKLKMKGAAGQRRVPVDFFTRLTIPLPPLAEQKHIAAILDAADELRAKRREAIAQLDAFLQSTFIEMFGDPVTNPMGWEARSLGEIIKVRSGDGLTAKEMAPGGLFPVYGGNGINGYHDKCMFEEPKIILGRVGVYCGAIHLTKPKSWVTDNALYVRELLRPLETLYLVEALRAANLNQYASQAAQPLISGGRIYPVRIGLPPLDLQHRFATIVESVEQQKAKMRAHLAELDTLFASLQNRAFNGEL